MSSAGDVLYSEDGNYWWDGTEWQPVATAEVAEELSPEDILEGSFIQELLGSEGEITDSVVEELREDPEMAAMYDADPDEFRAVMHAIVEGVLSE